MSAIQSSVCSRSPWVSSLKLLFLSIILQAAASTLLRKSPVPTLLGSAGQIFVARILTTFQHSCCRRRPAVETYHKSLSQLLALPLIKTAHSRGQHAARLTCTCVLLGRPHVCDALHSVSEAPPCRAVSVGTLALPQVPLQVCVRQVAIQHRQQRVALHKYAQLLHGPGLWTCDTRVAAAHIRGSASQVHAIECGYMHAEGYWGPCLVEEVWAEHRHPNWCAVC